MAEIKQLKEQDNEIAQLRQQLERLQVQVVLQATNQELPCKPAVAKANR